MSTASIRRASAVILAGGLSRRLGQDKRRLRLWGEGGPTLLERTVATVGALCADVVVVLNDPEGWPGLGGRHVPDAYPDGGALGGIYSGLAAAEEEHALVVACDFSLGMLRVGRRRDVGGGPDTGVVGGTGRGRVGGRGQVSFVAGDGTRLPFADGSFDAATISFGLRNVADPEVALRELARVTRSGGRLVVCEFSRPVLTPLRVVYLEYLMRVLPELARRVSSNPEAYVYLAESIRAWPDQQRLGRLIRSAGWGDVAYRNLTGGIVALHRAVRR